MKRILVGLIVLGLVVAAGAGVWLVLGSERPFKGYDGAEQFVQIPPGAGPAAISRRLQEAGIVRDELSFRVALWRSGQARRLQAGEYRFDRPMNAREVIDKLARGEVFMQGVTFPEGLTIRQMASLYEKESSGKAAEFIKAAQNTSLIKDIDPDATDLEG